MAHGFLFDNIDEIGTFPAYSTNEALLCIHENDQVLNKSFDGCRFFEIFDVTLDFSFFLFIF